MSSSERPDLLLDDTVSEITGVFEVEHVFPEVFKEEEYVPMGTWARIKAFFGFGRRAKKALPRQQGDGD